MNLSLVTNTENDDTRFTQTGERRYPGSRLPAAFTLSGNCAILAALEIAT